MGFDFDSLNPFDNGHVLDFGSGPLSGAWNGITGQTKNVPNIISAPKVDPSVSGLPTQGALSATGAGGGYGFGTVWQQLQDELSKAGGQGGTAATAATIDQTGDAAWAQQQQALADQLRATANGTGGPSPADLQLAAGTQANTAAALSVLGSNRGAAGANPGQLARTAAGTQAANNATLNQQLGVQRAQEAQAAQTALGGVLASGRGATDALATTEAGFRNQVGLANSGLSLSNAQLYDQELSALLGTETGIGTQEQNTAVGIAGTNAGLQNQANGQNVGIAEGNSQAGANLFGKVLSAGGGILAGAASDENVKSGIRGGNPMMDSFLRSYGASQGHEAAAGLRGVAGYAAPAPMRAPSDGGDADFAAFGMGLGKALKGKPKADQDGPVEAEDMLPEEEDPTKGLSFGAGIGGEPPAGGGINSYDDFVNALTPGLDYGQSAVPFTPVGEEAEGLDPSVLSALSDKKTKEDISSASYEQGLRDALAGKPGAESGSFPAPMVESFRRVMTDAQPEAPPAAPASSYKDAYARGWYPVETTPASAYQPPPGWYPAPQQPAAAPAPPPMPVPQAPPPLLAASDERRKTDLSKDNLGDMLDQLHAYNYKYKDPSQPGAAPGRHTGVMAQDLEKSRVGREFVHDTSQGKVVNYGQMAGVQLAASAYLNDRLDHHEEMLDELLKKRKAA